MSVAKENKSDRPGRSDVQQFEDARFHRWYNFVLGYSDQLVTRLLATLQIESGATILDPFCGTGTTLIEASKHGAYSIGIDANPFAVFASKIKTNFALDSDGLARAADRVEQRYRTIVSSNKRYSSEVTHLYLNDSGMIERGWISPKPLRKALALREAIRRGRQLDYVDPLLLALTADLPHNIGNMKFGPQIYCGPPKNDADVIALFRKRIDAMIEDLRSLPEKERLPRPLLFQGDARDCAMIIGGDETTSKVDFVICSPPYPTEHDYTRHTRLELAFTDGVSTKACVQRIKRSMIRSHTKGIYKGDSDEGLVEGIEAIENLARKVEVAVAGKESGFEKLYPTVVKSYFGGMKRHFQSVFSILKAGGKAAYVVGDQATYMKIPIQTAVLLGIVAETEGFKVDGITLWRQRWASNMGEYLDENILFISKP